MTKRFEHRIVHTELTLLSFRCRNCEMESTLEWGHPKQQHRIDELMTGEILSCGFCGHKFDKKFSEALGSFRDFLVRLKEAGQTITFLVPQKLDANQV